MKHVGRPHLRVSALLTLLCQSIRLVTPISPCFHIRSGGDPPRKHVRSPVGAGICRTSSGAVALSVQTSELGRIQMLFGAFAEGALSAKAGIQNYVSGVAGRRPP
jgi:hypothetical protein